MDSIIFTIPEARIWEVTKGEIFKIPEARIWEITKGETVKSKAWDKK